VPEPFSGFTHASAAFVRPRVAEDGNPSGLLKNPENGPFVPEGLRESSPAIHRWGRSP